MLRERRVNPRPRVDASIRPRLPQFEEKAIKPPQGDKLCRGVVNAGIHRATRLTLSIQRPPSREHKSEIHRADHAVAVAVRVRNCRARGRGQASNYILPINNISVRRLTELGRTATPHDMPVHSSVLSSRPFFPQAGDFPETTRSRDAFASRARFVC